MRGTASAPTALAALRGGRNHYLCAMAEIEQLRLAICGGEDAPGYAASLPLEVILQVQRDNQASARRDAELAWDGETANTWKARALKAEERVRELETEVLNATFSDRLDMDAGGSPLTWREVALKAETSRPRGVSADPGGDLRSSLLSNLRPEIADEVSYALDLVLRETLNE